MAFDPIMHTMLSRAGKEDVELVSLSEQERAAVARSRAAAAQGAFATQEEINAVWAKHGV